LKENEKRKENEKMKNEMVENLEVGQGQADG